MTKRLFDLGPEPAGGEERAGEPTAPGATRRVMLLVAYDGGPFHGFAPQADPAVPTIGGLLKETLTRMVSEEVSLTCAGRTDTGVHAEGQVVHVDLPAGPVDRWLAKEEDPEAGELVRLAESLTAQCGPAVAVWRARLAPDGFDARHSALARRYRYLLWRSRMVHPLWRPRSWHVPGELDLGAMRIGADSLLGEHDFAAFCRRPPGQEGPINRRVLDVAWKSSGHELSFEIEANAFCHHMVRSIVGSLVAVGRGRLTAAQLYELLRSGERSGAAEPAPPEGLVLELVRYPDGLLPGGVLTPL